MSQTDYEPCPNCEGKKGIYRITDNAFFPCSFCGAKGYLDQEDQLAIARNELTPSQKRELESLLQTLPVMRDKKLWLETTGDGR